MYNICKYLQYCLSESMANTIVLYLGLHAVVLSCLKPWKMYEMQAKIDHSVSSFAMYDKPIQQSNANNSDFRAYCCTDLHDQILMLHLPQATWSWKSHGNQVPNIRRPWWRWRDDDEAKGQGTTSASATERPPLRHPNPPGGVPKHLLYACIFDPHSVLPKALRNLGFILR